MKTSLTAGLDEKDAAEIRQEFTQSYHFREQLKAVLEAHIETINTSMRDPSGYENASWPYYQADRLGEIRAYKKLISLISE